MKDYLDILNEMEKRNDTTLKEVEEIEKEILQLNLDESMESFIKNKILKLKSRFSTRNTRKWDLFLSDISTVENIEEVLEFLNEIDENKDKTLSKTELEELENKFEKIKLILNDKSKFSDYYKEFCIREVTKKIRVFKNRLDRLIDPAFGEKIKKLREEKGLSLKDLEYLSGITASYINRIEKGMRKPSIPKLKSLALTLDGDVNELMRMLNYGDMVDDTNDLLKFLENTNYTIGGKVVRKRKKEILNEIILKIVDQEWYADEDNFDKDVEIAELVEKFHK